MPGFRGMRASLAFVLFTCFLAAGQARAAFIEIDGFPGVISGTGHNIVYYPLPTTSTTTNGSTYSVSDGAAHITLGGNGNTAGALELIYNLDDFDLTDGGTNTQFFLVMNRIWRGDDELATALSLTITVRDILGVEGTYNTGISSAPEGHSMVLNFDCSVNPSCFTPQPNFAHVDKVTVRLAFPENYASSSDITELEMDSIFVTPTGGAFPPEFTGGGTSGTWTQGASNSVTFSATGIPTPSLSLSGTLPAGITFNSATGVLSGVPAAGTMGTYTPVITATNKVGAISRAFSLQVQGPPSITSAASTEFLEGRSNSFQFTTTGLPEPVLSITSGALPTGVSLDTDTGVISGTPESANASYALTIKADNGLSPAATQTFTLNVDRAPRVNAFTATGTEDVSLSLGSASFDVTELDEQAVTVRIVSLPANGTLKLGQTAVTAGQEILRTALGNLTFVPDANYNGSTSFTWQASDGELWSGSVDATLEIAAANDAPVITEGASDSYITDEDTALVQTLHASDIDGDDLTWSVETAASHGTASVTGGVVTYQPGADFNGDDAFTVQVDDDNGGVATHAFAVTVKPVNDAPVITQGSSIDVTMDEDGAPTAFSLTLGATDLEDDTLGWSLQTAPATVRPRSPARARHRPSPTRRVPTTTAATALRCG